LQHSGSSPAQELLKKFGVAGIFFSESGMQALLDFEDTSRPVVLLQLMSVSDTEKFADYEQEIDSVWQRFGASNVFTSRTIGQLLGERDLMEVRAIEFPNAPMLIDAINTDQFAAAMATLAAATSDHAWVLGVEQNLPLDLKGGFSDPTLLQLSREEALALLAAENVDGQIPDSGLEPNLDVLVDMLVSDSPEPFYMVNLIDLRDQAEYADGRETDLSGLEANALYGQMIGPQLIALSSGPEILLPVSVILTKETSAWEQAVVVRYASRDAFLNIFALNPDVADATQHKDAAVEETLVYVSERRYDTSPEPVSGPIYNVRYCEIILANITAEGIVADVWSTLGLNLCPQDDWDAINGPAIAAELGAAVAVKNGPRNWVVDWASNTGALTTGETELFGSIPMRLLTTVRPAAGGPGENSTYRTNRVARSNVWHFVAGREVYELEDPEGTRYIMQALSQIVDPNQSVDDLATLGDRLEMPPGWSYHTRVLTNTLELPAIDGTAEVIQDEFRNTYQRVP
jgi:uncharacterized protein (DUF1330 family)